jgi:hypothetical protein
MASSTGTKTAARQEAPKLPTPAAGLHVFVAMQDFAIQWRGCTLSYRARTRYAVESPLKAALLATDRDIVWES